MGQSHQKYALNHDHLSNLTKTYTKSRPYNSSRPYNIHKSHNLVHTFGDSIIIQNIIILDQLSVWLSNQG